MTGSLVDTSVILDVLQGTSTVETEELLSNGISISIVTYFEVCKFAYKTGKTKELEFMKQKMDSFDIRGLTPTICGEAAKIAHSHKLSMADALIYSTAKQNELKLITSDSDLKGMEGVVFLKPKK